MGKTRRTGMILAAGLAALFLLGSFGQAVSAPGSPRMACLRWTKVCADDPEWSKDGGTWVIEDYSCVGGPKLLVTNDTGATATYVCVGKSRFKVVSATDWHMGRMDILVDGRRVATVDLRSEERRFGVEVYEGAFPRRPFPCAVHTLTFRCSGEGGPGVVEIDGETYDLTWVHFVNVQEIWVR